jgi:hypothetical protein
MSADTENDFKINPHNNRQNYGFAYFNVFCVFIYFLCGGGGTRQRSWLRHYATSREVVGSIPDEVDFFQIDLLLAAALSLWGSTQPLTEMSTRNLPAGKGWPAGA